MQKIASIINNMGKLSAVAQNLRTSVTSAQRVLSKQCIYLLLSQDNANANANGNGKDKLVVSGLLKICPKDLYLYDEGGQLHCSHNTPAILDFYVK
ncbi:GH24330 [Drosophila grimshawi]|uniref:GH24330 n=1 Tax=Drosophila grimshawi TaxID=7222 RepID=B4JMH1_DROGR|nr:GH24330 [Drosophila grimshawi]